MSCKLFPLLLLVFAGPFPAFAQPPTPTAPSSAGSRPSIPECPGHVLCPDYRLAPGREAPERDARGIPVISAPGTAPYGYNHPWHAAGPTGGASPTTSPQAFGSANRLPPCTRTVTDRCTQTYERNRPR
jgi:hypothetical protein